MRSTTPPGPDAPAETRAALVGCGSDKQATAAPAGKLYTSPYFSCKRDYATNRCSVWWVVSAEHGLISPETRIQPYKTPLSELPQAEQDRWGEIVSAELHAIDWTGRGIETLDILLGQDYIAPIEGALAEIEPTCCYLFEETSGNGEQAGLLRLLADYGNPATGERSGTRPDQSQLNDF